MPILRTIAPPRRDRAPRFAIGLATLAAIQAPSVVAHADPLVDVTIEHATGLPVLEARTGDAPWTVACIPPCTLRLKGGGDYRISGDGVVDSDVFRLPPAERVNVDAKPGSTMVRGVGTLFEIGGVVFAAGGGAILLVPAGLGSSQSDKILVGAGFLGAGLVVAVVGVALRILSETRVDVEAAP